MIPNYERRLDSVFHDAFDTYDEPMKDWVMIKFELRKLRLLLEEVRDEGELVHNEED